MSEQNQSQLPKPPTEAVGMSLPPPDSFPTATDWFLAVDNEGYLVDKTGKRVTEDDDNKNIAEVKANQCKSVPKAPIAIACPTIPYRA